MNTKNNFYKLLDITNLASKKEIKIAYQNKIIKFNNITKLSDNQISDIKMLKIALYVLLNSELKKNMISIFNVKKKKLFLKLNLKLSIKMKMKH